MARFGWLGLLIGVMGCSGEDCREEPSTRSDCSCARTCDGASATWTTAYCLGEEDRTISEVCAASCSGATCTQCQCRANGACTATICSP